MKKYLLLASLLLAAPRLMAQTTWVDGQDLSLSTDRGRGESNWQAHYDYAVGQNGSDAPALVSGRMMTLKGTLARATYARLYADITYLIASYGLKSARWVNGADPAAPANDPNRALLNWTAHQGYVLNTAGYDTANKLVGARLTALKTALPPADFARLYADCSILVLNFARMR